MKVAITGDVRKGHDESYSDHYQRIYPIIRRAVEESGFKVDEIACGRKNGVDRAVIQYAKDHGIPYHHYSIRFQLIAHADSLIAIDGGSKKTREVIDQMSREGKLVHVVKAPR